MKRILCGLIMSLFFVQNCFSFGWSANNMMIQEKNKLDKILVVGFDSAVFADEQFLAYEDSLKAALYSPVISCKVDTLLIGK